jgi:ABC-2 type transport system ATP-binding protein
MTDPNTTHSDAAAVKDALQRDPSHGSDMLIEFASKRKKNLYFQAILLKSRLNRFVSNEDQAAVIKEMIALADAIEQTEIPTVKNVEVKEDTAKREKYLERGILKKVVFECNSIYKRYKGFELQNVNLSLRLGEVTGIVGENANGKTTLLKIISGELLQDEGNVKYYFEGNEPDELNWSNIKRQVGYLPQELAPVNGTVVNNLRITASSHNIRGKANRLEVDYLLYRLGLDVHKDKTWKELSGGYRLRFALARILVRKPKLIVLDEPLANLDIVAQNILLNDLRDIANSINNPICVVLSSQSLEEVESVSDNMVVLSRGKILFNGATSSVGGMRTENWFEIRSPLSSDQFKAMFAAFGYSKFQNNGFSYLITAPLDKNLDSVLDYVLSKSIPVTYISDISNTTKKIILELNVN